MIELRNLIVELDDNNEIIKGKIAKKLHTNLDNIISIECAHKSIDARDKSHVFFVESFYIKLKNEKLRFNNKILKVNKNVHPIIKKENLSLDYRPLVVGSGPCGLFLALYLARKNLRPILIEQGKCIEERNKDVQEFIDTGRLNTKSNVQFGEGGAGTYSDGKLTTSSNSELVRIVIQEMINHGGPEDIYYLSKPHIGTDILRDVVIKIRNEIISLGGSVLFEHELVDVVIKDNAVVGAIINNNGKDIKVTTKSVFLAIGHSSRKTINMLYNKGIEMSKKPFAMGVRVEHLQEMINKAQYGNYYKHPSLWPADYKLITHLDNGRTVYTFCMCPGGEVINSSSEEGGVVVNGMSNYKRDSVFANSALLVNVTPSDIPGDSPLSGLEFQRKYEAAVYNLSNSYKPVIQTVGDFLSDRKTTDISREISLKDKVYYGSIDTCLPSFIIEALKCGIIEFDKHLKGFADKDAVLIGIESRSSSPVRIERNSEYSTTRVSGLYPCGEGAGYAGGIVTAAVDGIKVAQSFCKMIGNVIK